ncbi:hypothetical protein ACIQZO_30150 [Streptomyces sp. NPDC097617]
MVSPAGSLRTTLLIRPDGHIAWATEEPDPERLRAELARWPLRP